MTAPDLDPARDRAAAELAEADIDWRAAAIGWSERHDKVCEERDQLRAELERQRALIAAVLAVCDDREGRRTLAYIDCAEIRDLLEGERR